MESVIIADFGTMLGKTSERLVVRGPRPRLELIEGGPQLFLPMDLPARPSLRVLTSNGQKIPAVPIRAAKPKEGAPRAPRPRPEQVELPLFRISEIIVAAPGVSLSTDLIQACCERGIRLSFLTPAGQPFAMLSSPMLTATVLTRREQMAAYGDRRCSPAHTFEHPLEAVAPRSPRRRGLKDEVGHFLELELFVAPRSPRRRGLSTDVVLPTEDGAANFGCAAWCARCRPSHPAGLARAEAPRTPSGAAAACQDR